MASSFRASWIYCVRVGRRAGGARSRKNQGFEPKTEVMRSVSDHAWRQVRQSFYRKNREEQGTINRAVYLSRSAMQSLYSGTEGPDCFANGRTHEQPCQIPQTDHQSRSIHPSDLRIAKRTVKKVRSVFMVAVAVCISRMPRSPGIQRRVDGDCLYEVN